MNQIEVNVVKVEGTAFHMTAKVPVGDPHFPALYYAEWNSARVGYPSRFWLEFWSQRKFWTYDEVLNCWVDNYLLHEN